MGLHHLKDGVHAEIFVGIDRGTTTIGISGQKIRIDGSIQLGQILVDRFVVLRTDLPRARTAGRAHIRDVPRGESRRRELAVIGHVVPEPGRRRRSAGNQSGESRKGVGRLRGGSVVKGNAVRTQLRESRLRVAADIVRKVESVHAIDADEQNVPDPVSGIGVFCLQSQRDAKRRIERSEATGGSAQIPS